MSRSRFFKFIKNNRALAAVELALTLPVLMLLFMGGFEMTRYIIIQVKIAKTVASISDLISRSPSISETDITNSFAATQYLMEPYYSAANVKVYIYSVGNYGSGNIINWVRPDAGHPGGGGTYNGAASIGVAGGTPALASGFTLGTNEETIVAEIYYNFTPLIAPNIVGAQVIHKIRYTKPRLGALNIVKP